MLGRAAAHLTLYVPALLLYLVVLPRFYGLPALAQPTQLFVLAAPFILATSFLAQAIGAQFRYGETAVLLLLGLSIPLFFLVGFAWPREAIPGSVLKAASVFPSEFAIDGLVRLNQMGARLREVAQDWGGFWFSPECISCLRCCPHGSSAERSMRKGVRRGWSASPLSPCALAALRPHRAAPGDAGSDRGCRAGDGTARGTGGGRPPRGLLVTKGARVPQAMLSPNYRRSS